MEGWAGLVGWHTEDIYQQSGQMSTMDLAQVRKSPPAKDLGHDFRKILWRIYDRKIVTTKL